MRLQNGSLDRDPEVEERRVHEVQRSTEAQPERVGIDELARVQLTDAVRGVLARRRIVVGTQV